MIQEVNKLVWDRTEESSYGNCKSVCGKEWSQLWHWEKRRRKTITHSPVADRSSAKLFPRTTSCAWLPYSIENAHPLCKSNNFVRWFFQEMFLLARMHWAKGVARYLVMKSVALRERRHSTGWGERWHEFEWNVSSLCSRSVRSRDSWVVLWRHSKPL